MAKRSDRKKNSRKRKNAHHTRTQLTGRGKSILLSLPEVLLLPLPVNWVQELRFAPIVRI